MESKNVYGVDISFDGTTEDLQSKIVDLQVELAANFDSEVIQVTPSLPSFIELPLIWSSYGNGTLDILTEGDPSFDTELYLATPPGNSETNIYAISESFEISDPKVEIEFRANHFEDEASSCYQYTMVSLQPDFEDQNLISDETSHRICSIGFVHDRNNGNSVIGVYGESNQQAAHIGGDQITWFASSFTKYKIYLRNGEVSVVATVDGQEVQLLTTPSPELDATNPTGNRYKLMMRSTSSSGIYPFRMTFKVDSIVSMNG